jgi:hypothetical protein
LKKYTDNQRDGSLDKSYVDTSASNTLKNQTGNVNRKTVKSKGVSIQPKKARVSADEIQ